MKSRVIFNYNASTKSFLQSSKTILTTNLKLTQRKQSKSYWISKENKNCPSKELQEFLEALTDPKLTICEFKHTFAKLKENHEKL